MKNKNYSIGIVVVFFLIGFLLINQSPKSINIENIPENINLVKIAGQDIKVDLALTMSEKEHGLSGRTGLKEDEGLLFIFKQLGNYPFWMKDMNFPIDIIWIDGDLKVIYIKKDARPEFYPETYGPDPSLEDVKYVLEVVSGFSDKNNLQVGDKIEFIY